MNNDSIGATEIVDIQKEYNLAIFKDITTVEMKNMIQSVIDKNGFAPEHNYLYLCSHDSKKSKPYFVSFGDDKGLFCTEWDDKEWQIVSEIIAPKEERWILLQRFLKYLFENETCSKILVEFYPESRKNILRNIEDLTIDKGVHKGKLVAGKITHKFTTPILSFRKWNPELAGSNFSNLRKCKNRYHRNFKIEILRGDEAKTIPYNLYESLVHAWRKNRKCTDRAYYDEYLHFFKNGFQGSDAHIVLKIDGKLCGVASAWIVPNTNGKTVYYSINLHDYSIPELGDFLTITFLDELKLEGYEHLDFGSSDEKLLAYKKKFGIESQYETVVFYIRPETKEKRENKENKIEKVKKEKKERSENKAEQNNAETKDMISESIIGGNNG